MKKIFSLILSILIVVYTTFFVGVLAYAVDYDIRLGVRTAYTFKNISVLNDSQGATNISGLSVGAANDRVFIAKINNNNQEGVIYYIKDYNDSFHTTNFVNYVMKFKDGVIAHANGMAINNKHIFITKRGTNGKAMLVRIPRNKFTSANNNNPNNSNTKIVGINDAINGRDDSTGIYENISVYVQNGNLYGGTINKITKYTYNSTTGLTTFIVGGNEIGTHPLMGSYLKLYYLTYNPNAETVKTKCVINTNNILKIQMPFTGKIWLDNEYVNKYVYADIYFHPSYGLFLPIWDREPYRKQNESVSMNRRAFNFIIRANINAIDELGFIDRDNMKIGYINGNMNNNKNLSGVNNTNIIYSKYEIESISFIQHDTHNGNQNNNFTLIFSVNRELLGNSTGYYGNVLQKNDAVDFVSNPNGFLNSF